MRKLIEDKLQQRGNEWENNCKNWLYLSEENVEIELNVHAICTHSEGMVQPSKIGGGEGKKTGWRLSLSISTYVELNNII